MARPLLVSAPAQCLSLLSLLAGLSHASRPQALEVPQASFLLNSDGAVAAGAPKGKGSAPAEKPDADGEPFEDSVKDGQKLETAVKDLESQVSKSSKSANTVESDFQKYQATIKELQAYLDKFSDEQRKYNKAILDHFLHLEPERMRAFNEALKAAEEHRGTKPGAGGAVKGAAGSAAGGGAEHHEAAAEHAGAKGGPEHPAHEGAGGAAGTAHEEEPATKALAQTHAHKEALKRRVVAWGRRASKARGSRKKSARRAQRPMPKRKAEKVAAKTSAKEAQGSSTAKAPLETSALELAAKMPGRRKRRRRRGGR